MTQYKNPPADWDVIMFYIDQTQSAVIETFKVNPVGALVNDKVVQGLQTHSDRVECQVGLVSTSRAGVVQIDEPFTSHFMDPFVYAERMMKAGFTGVMVRTGEEFLDNFFKITYAILAKSVIVSGEEAFSELSKEYTKKK